MFQFFIDTDEPRYLLAFLLMMVMAGLAIASAMALKFCLYRSNKKLLRRAHETNTAFNPYVL